MAKVAFIGLGAMGARMAGRLIGAGNDLVLWNRSPARAEALAASFSGANAHLAESPRDAAEGADFIFSAVRDDEASRAVWLDQDKGALAGMKTDAIAVECSTLSLSHVAELAGAFRAGKRAFLDAPVVGSRPQAEAGALIFLAGGEAQTIAKAEKLFAAMGSNVCHAGPNGAGAALKLAVNALFGVQVAALAEVLGLMKRAGVAPALAAEIIGATPVAGGAAKGALASMTAGAFAPMFPVDLVRKDFGYVRAAARAAGAATPMADAAEGVLTHASANGMGADNLTGIVRLYL